MANVGLESNATPIKTGGNLVSSKHEQTVCLEEWWLVKSEKQFDGKSLAIEGFTLRKPRAMCVFSSAPIVKRYNVYTLRTADGITILVRGTINASRTLKNGFSLEVCSRFLLGFPYCWETYANPCIEDELVSRGVATSMYAFLESTTVLSSLPNFLKGRTNTSTHDHIFCFPGVTEKSVPIENVHASPLGKCSGDDLGNLTMHIFADGICSNPVLVDSSPEKTPSYEERSLSEIKHGREKDLLRDKGGEVLEKENNFSPGEKSKLKGDRCMYPENKVIDKNLFEENLEAAKSSDIVMLAAKEGSVNKEDCGIPEGTKVNEDTLFSNLDNCNNDSCNEHVLPLNEVVEAFDTEFLKTKETLIDREKGTEISAGCLSSNKQDNLSNTCIEDAENASHFSTSKGVKLLDNELPETKETSIDEEGGAEENEGSLLAEKQDNLNDTCNEPERDSIKENSSREKSKTPDDDIPVVQLNAEVTELSVLESLVTEETLTKKKDGEYVNLLSPSRRITRNSLKNILNPGKASNEHLVSKKSLEGKRPSASPNKGHHIKDFRSSRCTYSATKSDLPKDILVPMAKDTSAAHSSGVEVALTVDLKSSSKRSGSSKTSSKSEKKTRVNLKSSRPANSSCDFDSGKAGSLKEASASVCSDIKSCSPSEVNVAVPGIIPCSTVVSVRGFSKTKVGHGKSKETDCHSVSGSQGSNVIQLRVADKLSHGSAVSAEGILQESLLKVPLAGSHDILDIAEYSIDHTMENSPRQVNLETNVTCTTKMGIDTQTAAKRTHSSFKYSEGKGRKNTMCRKHLSGRDVTSPSICKIDAMEEIIDSPKGRRTNSRVQIARNKSKVDKPTNRDRSGLDRPNDRFQETVPRKTMRKVPPPRTAEIDRKMQYLNTPEQSVLNLKRSRCGRLLIPPLEFWRNEQVIYDEDREITGIQQGTPSDEYPRGSRSEPPKTRRRLSYS